MFLFVVPGSPDWRGYYRRRAVISRKKDTLSNPN